ncbi:RNase H family protein [Actinoallomurus oryzae]|uniref:RNase H family protein n=1 Tax=Actinoallomurus oryzae TaxID=502180 RepID=UPI0031F036A8
MVAAATADPDVTDEVLAEKLGIPPKKASQLLWFARRYGRVPPTSEDPDRGLRAAAVAIFTRAPDSSNQTIADELGIGKRRVYGLLRTAELLGEVPPGMRARMDQRSDCGLPLAFVWTDGSAPGGNRHGPAAWAAIIRWGAGPNAEIRKLGGRLSKPNIARAELAAAIHALRALDQPACVTMHCDHEALVDGATARAAPRAHRDLWNELREVSASHHVTWVWVRAHHTSRGNRAADSLARAVRKGSRLDESWREDLRAGRVANAVNHLVHSGRLKTLAWEFSTVGPLHRPTHIATAATVDGDTGESLTVTGTGGSKAAAKTDVLARLIAALHLE